MPIMRFLALAFSRATSQLLKLRSNCGGDIFISNVFASSSVSLIVWFVPVVIGRSDNFGFGLKTTL